MYLLSNHGSLDLNRSVDDLHLICLFGGILYRRHLVDAILLKVIQVLIHLAYGLSSRFHERLVDLLTASLITIDFMIFDFALSRHETRNGFTHALICPFLARF